jgi:hypothetical protein
MHKHVHLPNLDIKQVKIVAVPLDEGDDGDNDYMNHSVIYCSNNKWVVFDYHFFRSNGGTYLKDLPDIDNLIVDEEENVMFVGNTIQESIDALLFKSWFNTKKQDYFDIWYANMTIHNYIKGELHEQRAKLYEFLDNIAYLKNDKSKSDLTFVAITNTHNEDDSKFLPRELLKEILE